MTDGLVRVRSEINLPGEVWAWLEKLATARAFDNPAQAMSFYLTEAKKRDDHARGVVSGTPWPTHDEMSAGRAFRVVT